MHYIYITIDKKLKEAQNEQASSNQVIKKFEVKGLIE